MTAALRPRIVLSRQLRAAGVRRRELARELGIAPCLLRRVLDGFEPASLELQRLVMAWGEDRQLGLFGEDLWRPREIALPDPIGACAYLTPLETERLLGIGRTTLRRMALDNQIPTLWLAPHLRRFEARTLLSDAAPAVPASAALVSIPWLAALWRVHPQTLQEMARAGQLPLTKRRGRRGQGGAWVMPRRRFVALVCDRTTGDD